MCNMHESCVCTHTYTHTHINAKQQYASRALRSTHTATCIIYLYCVETCHTFVCKTASPAHMTNSLLLSCLLSARICTIHIRISSGSGMIKRIFAAHSRRKSGHPRRRRAIALPCCDFLISTKRMQKKN